MGTDRRSHSDAARLEARLAGKRVDWPRGRLGVRVRLSHLGSARGFEARVPALCLATPARRDLGPAWHLVVHLSGRGRYRIRDRRINQRPGAVLLLDTRTECAVEHPDGAHVVSWILPEALMAPYLPARSQPVEQVADGVGSVLAGHAVALARGAGRVEASAEESLAAHLAALAGLALAAGRTAGDQARPSHTALMRQRILGLIEARFREPGLTASAAARDLGMSRRWLHALLAGSGTGFAERLRERRLTESLRLLRDPGADRLSVTQIGLGAGFNDLATFHRQFRRRYGATPGAMRADRGPGPAQSRSDA